MTRLSLLILMLLSATSGCTTTNVSSHCSQPLSGNLDRAMSEVEQRLASGC